MLNPAGIYYAKDSWKARLCVQGREMMYAFCREYNVPFRQCGKLIVASSEAQSQQLQTIAKKALGNGVTDLKWLSRNQAKEVEPHVQCHKVTLPSCPWTLHSASIVESLAILETYQAVVWTTRRCIRRRLGSSTRTHSSSPCRATQRHTERLWHFQPALRAASMMKNTRRL